VLAGLAIAVAVPAAAAPALSAAQFATRLESLAASVDAAPLEAAGRVAASIPERETVVIGTDVYDVRFDWLRSALAAPAADQAQWKTRRSALSGRLRALAREASAGPTAAPPATAHEALTGILAARGFQNTRTRSWQAQLMHRIREYLADLWERTLGRRVGRRTAAVVLAWTASIAAIVVLLIWLARMAASRRAEQPIDLGMVTARRTPGRELALEAAALARAGRVREAARLAYRAAVHRLDEEGSLRLDEARTPREYLRLLPPPHRRRAALQALTETFERIWYGSRPPAARDGEAIIALLQDLECLSPDRAN